MDLMLASLWFTARAVFYGLIQLWVLISLTFLTTDISFDKSAFYSECVILFFCTSLIGTMSFEGIIKKRLNTNTYKLDKTLGIAKMFVVLMTTSVYICAKLEILNVENSFLIQNMVLILSLLLTFWFSFKTNSHS